MSSSTTSSLSLSFTTSSAQTHSYIIAEVATMREGPQSKSKVASQAIFSEKVEVIRQENGWVKIMTLMDQYSGWIKANELYQSQEAFLDDQESTVMAKVNRLSAFLYEVDDTEYGPMMRLPYESLLKVLEPLEESSSRWLKVSLPNNQIGYIQRGDLVTYRSSKPPASIKREHLCEFSKIFLGIPYHWGGRSSFGFDCSGFVQMLYRQIGISLPRDSIDQANFKQFKQISFDALKPVDLVFFGPEKRITHVGMYLGDGEFIHSAINEQAPYIHVSKLSNADWNGSGKLTNRFGCTLVE